MDLACIAKVFDCTNFKILSPKQMLHILTVALAHLQGGDTSKNVLMKAVKNYILFIKQKKLLKSI